MDDKIAAIHQDPLRLRLQRGARTCRAGGAFYMPHRTASLTKNSLDMILQRVKVPRVVGGAQDEKIGHGGDGPQVHHDDVLALLLEGRSRCNERFRLAIESDGAQPLL